MKKGFTLVEVLIGIFLTVIIFLGIFGAYQLSLKAANQYKIKVTATAIATGQIEEVKNLAYASIGVKGGFPDGVLEAVTSTIQNGIQFTIEKKVDYIVDPADGIASPQDPCPNDYKRLVVKVSWSGNLNGNISFATDIAPKNLSQECASGGGILSVLVFDAYGATIASPFIEVKNPSTDATIKSATPDDGQYYFPLATTTYKIVVSKDGYTTERTYGTNEITTPEKPNPLIIEDQSTPVSFSIDKISSFLIDTYSPWGSDYFYDSFLNENKISEKSNLIIDNGQVILATSDQGYLPAGYLISNEISPADFIRWDKFSFSDIKPISTDIKYQIYYSSGTNSYLIPDSDLPGNSIGFNTSPLDLSGISTTTYDKLKLKGNFSSASTNATPILNNWQLSWVTSEAVSLSNTSFKLQGNKIIGQDSQENPVYEYSISTTTDASGHKDIQNLEWDLYTFAAQPSTGLNLVDIQPSPQPVNLLPGTISLVKLYFDSQNSLLVTVEDANTLEPVFSATVRLYNSGLSYDVTQHTNTKGQTLFIPLSNATYNLEISNMDYLSTSTTAYVSGNKIKTIKLEQPE